jgi:hypothetical protein
MLEEANGSAISLVLSLADNMLCFRDEHIFEDRAVNFYKRNQILVAGMDIISRCHHSSDSSLALTLSEISGRASMENRMANFTT